MTESGVLASKKHEGELKEHTAIIQRLGHIQNSLYEETQLQDWH